MEASQHEEQKHFFNAIENETSEQLDGGFAEINELLEKLNKDTHVYLNYIQEKDLTIQMEGLIDDQINECENTLDRMKEIVQRKELSVLLAELEEIKNEFEKISIKKEKLKNLLSFYNGFIYN